MLNTSKTIFADPSLGSQYNSGNNYINTCSTSKSTGFKGFIRSILPPPPDKRIVQFQHNQIQQNQVPILQASKPASTEVKVQQIHITNLNTTLIGDYIAAVYPEYQDKWLVQVIGNATFNSTLDAIIKENLIINRKYIFLQLGGNQVRTSNKSNVHKQLLAVIVAIRQTQK